MIFLALTHLLVLGSLLPISADPKRWFWLGLSGIIGLVIGDAFLFQAFVWIGPRLSMLMLSLAPVIAALVAWVFLGETLSAAQIIGILLVLFGIAWVVLERNGKQRRENRDYFRGILFGLGAATGQALGLVLAKNGLYGDFSPISANLIRMIAAAVIIWMITFFQRKARSTIQRVKDRSPSTDLSNRRRDCGSVLGRLFIVICCSTNLSRCCQYANGAAPGFFTAH